MLFRSHHAFKNLTEWKSIVKKLWNIDHTEIDEIAIVVDPWHYGIEDKSFFPETEFNHLETPTKTTRLHHHYAHALSAWMMGESSLQIVIDGFGDADIAYTVIKDNKILEVGSLKDYGSLGLEMSTVGYKFGMINTHGLDIAGKLMGLQSYGNIDYEFKQELKPYGIRNVKEIFDYSKWEEHKGDKVDRKSTRLNSSH